MNHAMIVESAEEREARGHPLGYDTPYQAMGGLTGFSSLAEGYMRLDPSGRGQCKEEVHGSSTQTVNKVKLLSVFLKKK